MQDRQLSGIFVRVQRDGKWLNKDFTDLTEEEMRSLLDGKTGSSVEWTKSLAIELAKTIRAIGDQFDISTAREWQAPVEEEANVDFRQHYPSTKGYANNI